MKRKLVPIVLCMALVLSSVATAFADTSQGTAATLRLEKAEGKVAITKTGGKSVTVKEGIRLYDGYELKTDKNSAAYVSLDSERAIMLNASTDVTIKKNGKKLEIMLKSGTVLVNVEEKLAGDEELNIRTTNSVTGIRGTILQATFIPQTGNSEIYLFQGATGGNYQAPDGTWYTQSLTTGSWLASGTGLLEDNPEYNGWTKEEGHWVYTNSKLEAETESQCWSAEKGWYTLISEIGEEQDAWTFGFRDLTSQDQEEILGDPGMLARGQEHLDLYPELADEELPETKVAVEKAIEKDTAAAEAEDAAIKEAYEKGNGGNTVDNLFEEGITGSSGTPVYAVNYYESADAAHTDGVDPLGTVYYSAGADIDPPDDFVYGYILSDWSYDDPYGNLDVPIPTVMGTEAIDCWPNSKTSRTYSVTMHYNSAFTINSSNVPESTTPDVYEVEYDFPFAFSMPGGPTYAVTDQNGNFYAADPSNVFLYNVDITGDMDIYVSEIDDFGDYLITAFAADVKVKGGQVLYFSNNFDGTYTIQIAGNGSAQVEITDGVDANDHYRVVSVYPDDTPGEPITPVGNVYTITGNTTVDTEGLFGLVLHEDATVTFSPEPYKFYDGEYFFADGNITFTVAGSDPNHTMFSVDDGVTEPYTISAAGFYDSGGGVYHTMLGGPHTDFTIITNYYTATVDNAGIVYYQVVSPDYLAANVGDEISYYYVPTTGDYLFLIDVDPAYLVQVDGDIIDTDDSDGLYHIIINGDTNIVLAGG